MVASRGQQVRAAARRRAVQAQERRREQERARQKRCVDLGVEVSVALAQRDEAVEHFEQQAGRALDALMGEGFSLAEATGWSGVEGLSTREAQRLRKAGRARLDQDEHDEPGERVVGDEVGAGEGAPVPVQ